MKQTFQKIMLDMIPVIFGILIALMLNNWNENRNNAQFVSSIIQTIEKELSENKLELETKIEEHHQLLDTINLYIDKEVMIGEIVSKTKGVRAVLIKNTAWKSFLNPNIKLVDYELISILTDIEESKDAMNIIMNKMMDFIYANLDSNNTNKKEIFHTLIYDLKYIEEDLLESHNKFLTYSGALPQKNQ